MMRNHFVDNRYRQIEINFRVKVTDSSSKRAQLHSEITELGISSLSSWFRVITERVQYR
jgi:hypothetical protein